MNVNKHRNSKKYYFILPLILLTGVLIAMLVNYSQSIKAATERTKATLSDSANIQAKILRTTIETQYSILDAFANEISSKESIVLNEALPQLRTLADSSFFVSAAVSLPDGLAYSHAEKITDISEKQFFKDAIQGKRSIYKSSAKSSDGSSLFVIAVPIVKDDAVIGVIHGSYTEDILKSLLINEIQGYRSYSFICSQNGEILIKSLNEKVVFSDYPMLPEKTENIFDFLNESGILSGYSINRLKDDLVQNKTGVISLKIDGSKKYAFFSPLKIQDWYMFNIVPEALINTDVSLSTRSNLFVAAIVMIFSMFAVVLIVIHEKRTLKEIKHEKEQIRISEELYRVAMSHTNSRVSKYDIKTQELYLDEYMASEFGTTEIVPKMPFKMIEEGIIDAESADQFIKFYESIAQGSPENSCIVRANMIKGEKWIKMSSTVVLDSKGLPAYAIISYENISELREKEIAYEKWRMSILAMPQNEITLYEYNLSKNSFIRKDGTLIQGLISSDSMNLTSSFDFWAKYIADNLVFAPDAKNFLKFMDRDELLDLYFSSKKFEVEFDFRLVHGSDYLRWTRVGIQMVPYADSSDVKAFVLFKDIEENKRQELVLMSRLTEDTLTKTLNRASFIEKVGEVIAENPNSQHAIIIIDVDNFKYINDNFGHTAGDQTLITISNNLKSVIRQGDLFGRIGGDEFMILIKDIPYDALVEKRARQICDLMRKDSGNGISISGSLGIALYPRDGTTFEELYQKSDLALYKSKKMGKNGFSIYDGNADSLLSATEFKEHSNSHLKGVYSTHSQIKKSLLIVDNDEASRELLSDMFKDSFNVLTATDSDSALETIYKYRLGISVVLLDIFMPGITGIEVLKTVYEDKELSTIPFIVISDANERKYSLQAIEQGASDFISKPIEPRLVALRVQNAINKAENDKLRVQNSYLLLQSMEESRYRHVLKNTGTIVFEYDWSSKIYSYDSLACSYLWGSYDHRRLWDIFLEDGVADEKDIKRMQDLEFKITNTSRPSDTLNVRLKAASGDMRWFKMNASKLNGDDLSSNKILITFNDINEDVLKNEKLIYQAEYDSVTKLYNLDAFLVKTREMIKDKPANSYIMMYFDIEKFKLVNYIFGHAEGNRLLEYIASKTEIFTGDEGGTSCHISSDYFAVCIPYSPSILTEKMSDYINEINRYDLPFECSLNFGLYIIEDTSLPIDVILDRAALAQREIKNNSIKRYAFYTEEMHMELQNERLITGIMNESIEKGQFDIYLQPQYNLKTGEIEGAEALVRWNHPEKGLISPETFIPIFEKTGFILKLDEYVWERTFQVLRSWGDSGKNLVPVSVNIAYSSLFCSELFKTLAGLSAKYDIPPEFFKLELNENIHSVLDQVAPIVKTLKDFGFSIELDDFGSGFLSVNPFGGINTNALKLDIKSLGANYDELGKTKTVLKRILEICKDLNISVIAKCVETKEQSETLIELGFELAQGYYYAKPMNVSDFGKLIS